MRTYPPRSGILLFPAWFSTIQRESRRISKGRERETLDNFAFRILRKSSPKFSVCRSLSSVESLIAFCTQPVGSFFRTSHIVPVKDSRMPHAACIMHFSKTRENKNWIKKLEETTGTETHRIADTDHQTGTAKAQWGKRTNRLEWVNGKKRTKKEEYKMENEKK